MSLSVSEKTTKREESVEELSSLFEVEKVLTVIGLKHFVYKVYFLGWQNRLCDTTLK